MDHQITVKELNSLVKNLLENEILLQNIWIKGEVSNLKIAMSGHIYFTLKDENAAVSVALFKSQITATASKLKNGQQILIKGKISLYEKTGSYQLYAQEIEEAGIGNIYHQIEELKSKLIKEGIFDNIHKKDLPANIEKIGVITSSKGAVLHDIKKVVGKRNPFVEIIIYPVTVQGDEAPKEICKGIESFNKYGEVDVIIVARGGGSIEDLMAFNSEMVIREVYKSAIPVISAVGHETDTTLIDYVADIRGATPSHAAELATINIRDRLNWLKDLLIKNENKILGRIESYYQELDLKSDKLKNFHIRIKTNSETLENSFLNLKKYILNKIDKEQTKYNHIGEKLNLVSPLNILKKGYSIAYNEKDQVVNSSQKVKVDDKLKIKLYQGDLSCVVTGKDIE
ncbi:MAG: exodeoxyribonuclease VII large subunit [Fusobacteria bacterium]|nr:exodeoxyribonuclease VII large subunit [Fusobacteriota bacterium]